MKTPISVLLDRANAIADSIVKKAKVDHHGIFWYANETDVFTGKKSETIDTGKCGIILFLLELYSLEKNPNHLEVITGGLQWAIDHSKKSSQPISFYQGKAGLVFTLIKAYEVTRNEQFL